VHQVIVQIFFERKQNRLQVAVDPVVHVAQHKDSIKVGVQLRNLLRRPNLFTTFPDPVFQLGINQPLTDHGELMIPIVNLILL
jgi:hypothetical protein